jgi:hypothetical protein
VQIGKLRRQGAGQSIVPQPRQPPVRGKRTRFGLADTSYTNQAAFFDYDRDGDLDLYLLTSTNQVRNPNLVTPVVADGTGPANDKLYRNDSGPAGPRFTDVTHAAGILHDGFGLGLSVADFNGTGGRMSTWPMTFWPMIFCTSTTERHV